MERILNLITEKIGLDANSIGVYSLENTIKRRMEYYNFNHPDSYLIHLQNSPEELKQLIELIVVPETWFFRDKESFVFLNKYLTTEWIPKNTGKILRVLSMPCATGEEPFSIAITLTESGLNYQNFSIDAIDISYQSLHKARTGIYEKNSFRGDDISYRDRYFLPTNNRYQLYDFITKSVDFSYGNILDDLFMLNKQPYDIIFCRNLLIYLHNNARQKAMDTLKKLLKENGILFVGYSETSQLLSSNFVSVRHPLAFAYRKSQIQTNEILKKPEILPINLPEKKYLPPVKKIEQNEDHWLEKARNLANQGKLEEAEILCQNNLNANITNAEMYLLLGEISQSQGKIEQSEKYFNKVLYLQPNHYEGLMYLILIKEKQGDLPKAAILRQRLQRLT